MCQHYLATGYPSHGFVIDRQEAADLFYSVYGPNEEVAELAEWLRLLVDYGGLPDHGSPILEYLNQGISEHLVGVLQIIINAGAPSDGVEDESSD